MLKLYADEQFPRPVVLILREKEYDILTVQDAKQDNQNISDPQVLAFAAAQGRAVITENRRDFIALHNRNSNHLGIIVCKKRLDWDWQAYAIAIDTVLAKFKSLENELVRMNQHYSDA